MNEQQLEALIEHFKLDLADEMTLSARQRLLAYLAASELWAELQQPADAGQLRMAVCAMCLDTLGIGSQAIDAAKIRLTTGREPASMMRN